MKFKFNKFFKDNYILFFTLYYICIFMNSTSIIIDYPLLDMIEKIVRLISLILMSIRILINFFESKGLFFNFLRNKNYIIYLVLAILFFLSVGVNALIIKNIKWISLIIVVLSAYDEDVNKVIKRVLILQVILSFLTVGFCGLGLTQDYIVVRADGTIRHSLGFTYTTLLSQIILFSSLIYIYTKNFEIVNREIFSLEIINILTYFITDSKTELLFFELIILLVYLKRHINICKVIKKYKRQLVYGMIALPTISILLVLLYPLGGFMNKLDNLLSNRLQVQYDVLSDRKVNLFGNNITMVGFGLEDAKKYGDSTESKYNYIDNEYMQMLILNGACIYIYILFMIILTLKMIINKKQYNIFIFVYVYLLFSLFNPRLFDLVFSPVPFIIMCGIIEAIKLKGGNKKYEKEIQA